jgi:hypothetical protein
LLRHEKDFAPIGSRAKTRHAINIAAFLEARVAAD